MGATEPCMFYLFDVLHIFLSLLTTATNPSFRFPIFSSTHQAYCKSQDAFWSSVCVVGGWGGVEVIHWAQMCVCCVVELALSLSNMVVIVQCWFFLLWIVKALGRADCGLTVNGVGPHLCTPTSKLLLEITWDTCGHFDITCVSSEPVCVCVCIQCFA